MNIVPGIVGVKSKTGNPYMSFKYVGSDRGGIYKQIMQDVDTWFNGSSILYFRSLEENVNDQGIYRISLRVAN